MDGFNNHFLGDNFMVEMPDCKEYINEIAINAITSEQVLDYTYYSVIQNKSRRVPIVSASNIYRIKFEKADRSGTFKKDSRIKKNEQLTTKDLPYLIQLKQQQLKKVI